MKKFIILALSLCLMPIFLQATSEDVAATPAHVFKVPNPQPSHYDGPRSTPTLVDTIDLSPINPTGYCWGITYDWDRDVLWITQWNSAYPTVYAIQKTSPCTKVDSFTLGSGAPSYHLGIGYAGNDIMYMAGFDANVYQIDMITGNGTVYRSMPWSSAEGLGFNAVDDAIYPSDWSADQCAWAIPSQSGSWNTWSVASAPCGMSGAWSASTPPDMIFQAEEANPAHFYQYSVSGGVPNTTPDSVWDCDPGQTQGYEADCAFDGRYVYILDQSGPDKVWVYDVGIAGTNHDVGTQAILAPGATILPNTTINPSARYRNYGGYTETFDVYFLIDSAGVNIYSQSANITLNSGTDTTITWPSWTSCGTSGITYDITAYTVLSGDENPANDTLTSQTIVTTVYWEILSAQFPSPSSGHEMATIHDGKYMVFGIRTTGGYLSQTQIYDIAAGSWSAGPDNPYGCGAYGSAQGVNGKYYRIGGTDSWPTALTRVDIYDPSTSQWSSGAASPRAWIDHATGVYNDSLIFCLGGGNWGTGNTPHTDVYFYDTYLDSWTQATSMPGVGRGCLAGGVIDTFAIVACGYDGTSTYRNDYIVGIIDQSDASQIAWGSPTNIPGMAGRYRVPSGVDHVNKELWVVCGQISGGASDETWSYNPYTDTWTNWNKPKPHPMGNVSPVVVTTTAAGDFGVFVASGYFNGSYITDHEVFHTGMTGIEEKPGEFTQPTAFGFAPDMPNPVKGYAPITYTTTKPGPVTLKVFDISGRLVKTLVNRVVEPQGTKTVYWTLKDDSHRPVANGVYFLRLEVGSEVATHKLTVVK